MQFGKHKLTRCRYGWMLHNGPFIGKCFELYGQYSESEIVVLRSLLRPGDTALDVGANIGDLTVPMSHIVGETGRVYAVESHTDTFNVLCANLALNNIHNVKPLNHFISDTPDVDTSGPWGQFGFVSQQWGPTFASLDSFGIESCRLIKIDVDGKELQVIRSAASLITRCRPMLYFENDDRALSPALLGHVLGLDYAIFWHLAPIFEPDNFFGNPINHWHPTNINSQMMIGIPREQLAHFNITMRPVSGPEEWWDTPQTGL
jgi:Methyltransferase FkbM domain